MVAESAFASEVGLVEIAVGGNCRGTREEVVVIVAHRY